MSLSRFAVIGVLGIILFAGCGGSDSDSDSPQTQNAPEWEAIRAAAAPEVMRSDLYGTPQIQPIATDGWEDGLFISRDGLTLFAVYIPCDLLTFINNGADQNDAADYLRGPTLGMDLTAPALGYDTWIQGDIVYATRSSTTDPFSSWRLSSLARPLYSEGAVSAQAGNTGWELFAYATNDQAPGYKAHLYLARDVAADPTGRGTLLPAPVTDLNGSEDNPHIERLSPSNLVLFFESDRTGGTGDIDLWFTTSADDGASWALPEPVSALNTAGQDIQPHLWQDSNDTWWLWYTSANPADGKLGIWRAQQTLAGDWNAWSAPELMVGSGNAAGIGEPTLTADGDLSFVVVYENPDGSATDRLDADPWFLPHQ